MTTESRNEQKLRDEVTEIRVKINEILIPGMRQTQETIAKMSFVDTTQYLSTQQVIDRRLKLLEENAKKTEPIIAFWQKVTNKITQIFVILVIIILMSALVSQVPNLRGLL